MATQLGLYNGALIELGEARLASLTETREGRYLLDAIYSDVLADCLSEGLWNFAMRSVKIDADTAISPDFGYNKVFDKPSDWVRTAAFTSDEFFNSPINDYVDEVGFWACEVDPIYVMYVSNGSGYGGDLTLFPPTYRRFVEVALADRICMGVTQNVTDKQRLERQTLPFARRNALNKDAMNEGAKFPRVSTWNRARMSGSRRERGKTSSLTG